MGIRAPGEWWFLESCRFLFAAFPCCGFGGRGFVVVTVLCAVMKFRCSLEVSRDCNDWVGGLGVVVIVRARFLPWLVALVSAVEVPDVLGV